MPFPLKNKSGHVNGEAHYNSKLTVAEVVAIFLSAEKPLAIALTYHISVSTVHKIKKRKTWGHVTEQFTAPKTWRTPKKQP